MSVRMIIQFNGKYLELPVNPEQISITNSATNTSMDIIGLGKATRKGEPELETIKIESFFPGSNSYFYTGKRPKSCIEFIKEIWNTENTNNNVAKLIISGIPIAINMYFVIDNFTYDHRAGEEEDIYYTLEIKRYVPYGVKLVETTSVNNTTSRVESTNVQSSNNTNAQKTYAVKSGDCLWNITKACTGNGNDWSVLYQLNKSVIGSNPSLIKPGQVLTLPTNWNEPKNVVKLKPIAKTSTQKLDESSNKTTTDNKTSNTVKSFGAGGSAGSR